MPFLQQLQAEAMRNADDPINEMMQRMCAPLSPPALLRTAVACETQMTLACETATALPFPSDKTIPSHNGQHSHTVSDLTPDLSLCRSQGGRRRCSCAAASSASSSTAPSAATSHPSPTRPPASRAASTSSASPCRRDRPSRRGMCACAVAALTIATAGAQPPLLSALSSLWSEQQLLCLLYVSCRSLDLVC